jgi:hypothetical protein
MSKINRLRKALASGSFWNMFEKTKPKPYLISNSPEIQQKSLGLWDKYVQMKRRYLEGNVWVPPSSPLYRRFEALYFAHQRDLARLFRSDPTL